MMRRRDFLRAALAWTAAATVGGLAQLEGPVRIEDTTWPEGFALYPIVFGKPERMYLCGQMGGIDHREVGTMPRPRRAKLWTPVVIDGAVVGLEAA